MLRHSLSPAKSLPFSFEGVADTQGVIQITRRVPVGPLRIQLTRFSLRTHNGCNSRTHTLSVQVNGVSVYQGVMRDCVDLTIHSDRSWRGVLSLHFTADGFDSDERVVGDGAVEFRTSIL